MLATIMQKDIFDHNFRTKARRMAILESGYVSKAKEFDDAICCDL